MPWGPDWVFLEVEELGAGTADRQGEPAGALLGVPAVHEHVPGRLGRGGAGEHVGQRVGGQGNDAHEVVRDLRLRLDLDLPSEQRILNAAAIKADHPMAHADAFAATTAAAHDATLLTGDPELLLDNAPWRWEDLRATTNR